MRRLLASIDGLDRLVTVDRARGYALLLLAGYALGLGGIVLSLRAGLDPRGKPLGADFIIFYGASVLVLKGKAALAWSAPALLAAERTAVPASRALFLWCYPPTFLLLIAPLAKLPYVAALVAWLAATGAGYLAMMRMLVRDRRIWWLALAFPGVFVCVMQGQNGLLSAAVLGAGLLWLDRRPWLAGAVLGLIAYKPHFGLLLPLLLVGTGRWRSLLAAALSVAAFVGVSAIVFGVESWRAFLEAAPQVRASLQDGALPLAKMPSVFAAARQLDAPLALAYGLQAAVAGLAALATLAAWRRPGPLALKAGLAVTATLLATPYAFDYDLVLLAIPIGAVAVEGRTRALPRGVPATLAAAAFAPLVTPPLASYLHLPVTPLVLAALFVAVRRVLAAQAQPSPAQALAPGLSGFATLDCAGR